MPRPDHSGPGLKLYSQMAILCWGLICITNGVAFSDQPPVVPAKVAPESPEFRAQREKLDALILAVRANEALFRNLDVTYRTSWKFQNRPAANEVTEARVEGGSVVSDDRVETRRQVTLGDRLYFSGSRAVVLESGDRPDGQTVAVCDGMQTLIMDEGNCATLFQRRFEPASMFPPHSWGLFAFEVNFPLSLYLSGTEAMRSDPKVRRFPVEAGSVFEFNKVEAEWQGEEMVGNLSCCKIRLKRWHYPQDPPRLQTLWMAKDRNFHVAKCQAGWDLKGKEVASDSTHVVKWRELQPGLWLPSHIENQRTEPHSDAALPPVVKWTRRLTLVQAELNPTIAEELFQFPEVPKSIPKFEISADGRMVDGPRIPRPVTGNPQTTLQSIIDRLIVEEARYDQIELEAVVSYRYLNRSDTDSRGYTSTSESAIRSVISGQRKLYQVSKQSTSTGGATYSSFQRRVFDGQKMYGVEKSSSSTKPEEKCYGDLSMAGSANVRSVRAHSTLLDGVTFEHPLSTVLTTGLIQDRSFEKLKIEYVGDEIIGDLHCHKLKCSILHDGDRPESFFFLWLARDRNLVSVRRESHERARSSQLPIVMEFVEKFREIRPGVWFPESKTTLVFQWFSRDGLCEGRPLLQWRQDQHLKSLTVDPIVNDATFAPPEVPEGTQILVTDADGTRLGRFKQAAAGKIDITQDQLLELRQKKKVGK